jgi:hypothetical protein
VKRQRVQEPDGSSVAESPTGKGRKSLAEHRPEARRYQHSNKHNNAGRRGSSPDKYFRRQHLSIALHQTKRFKQHVTCANSSPRKSNRNFLGGKITPQSLAAGIVYFVIRLNDIPSRKQTFALSAMHERGYFDKMCTQGRPNPEKGCS